MNTFVAKQKVKISFMAEVNIHSEEKIKNKEAAQNAKSKSILESFEYIVELAEDSNLGKDFFDKAGKHIRYAARKLHLSPMQTVLLAMFVDRSEDSRIQISDSPLCRVPYDQNSPTLRRCGYPGIKTLSSRVTQ